MQGDRQPRACYGGQSSQRCPAVGLQYESGERERGQPAGGNDGITHHVQEHGKASHASPPEPVCRQQGCYGPDRYRKCLHWKPFRNRRSVDRHTKESGTPPQGKGGDQPGPEMGGREGSSHQAHWGHVGIVSAGPSPEIRRRSLGRSDASESTRRERCEQVRIVLPGFVVDSELRAHVVRGKRELAATPGPILRCDGLAGWLRRAARRARVGTGDENGYRGARRSENQVQCGRPSLDARPSHPASRKSMRSCSKVNAIGRHPSRVRSDRGRSLAFGNPWRPKPCIMSSRSPAPRPSRVFPPPSVD